ncbi:hypothetical protein [Absidia glauca]|uniref:RlpA-like protein double-psi beta-barrel domain-containing protein n=1 Tax=Absidia glauca TaxID=4829 RepID=A0A168P8W7_ABSGL|nr:hypothetical protein [Absidia glauca]
MILLVVVGEFVQAAPVHSKSKQDTSYYTGSGTFFYPTKSGAEGACGGAKESSNSDTVALNSAQYGPMDKKSKQCGKKVLIKHGDKSTVATVRDACPGCQESKYHALLDPLLSLNDLFAFLGGLLESLDMTPAVFTKLASQKQGVIPITWCFVGEKNSGTQFEMKIKPPRQAQPRQAQEWSYSSHREPTGNALSSPDIRSNKKTHINCGSSARMAGNVCANVDQVRHHGRWNSTTVEGISHQLPREMMQSMEGFHTNG